MRHCYLLLSVGFLLLTLAARGQAYEPGLLVRANGDTLRGEVENSFWVEPPGFIHFRRAAGSPVELYQPQQLRAVQFTPGRYFRYEAVSLDHAAQVDLQKLPRDTYYSYQTDTLLAEVLLEGPVSLRRVVRQGVTHYVLRRAGQPPLSLGERRYLRQDANGTWNITDGNDYVSKLTLYFGDCPAAVALIQRAPFTPAGLTAVAQAYVGACATAPVPVPLRSWLPQATPRRLVAVRGGVLAGARYNRTERTDRSRPGSQDCADCQARPFGGLYAEMFQPGRAASVYMELSLSPFRGGGTSEVGYNPTTNQATYAPYTYQAWLRTARLGLRAMYPLPHEQYWLIGVGFETNRVLRPRLTAGTRPAGLRDQDFYFADVTYLPNMTLGWRRRRLTLALDGQLYTDSQNYDGFSSLYFGSNFALRLGLGYQLGRNPDAAQPARTRP